MDKLYKAMDGDAIWCQFVVLANFCNKVKEFSSCLKAYLDLKGCTGDVITVGGHSIQGAKDAPCHLFLE
jgi:hypothetical protein